MAKLDPEFNLLQATYFGSAGVDLGYAIARDSAGHIFLGGSTESTDLPGVASGAQPVFGGGFDAFVAKFSADLKTLMRTTYVGGTGFEQIRAMAVDANDHVFAVGTSDSTVFPGTQGGAQATNAGGTDAFVAIFDADLAPPGRATYIGGSGEDEAHAEAVNPLTGAIAIAGNTASTDLPVTPGSNSSPLRGGTGGGGYRSVAAAATAGPAQAGHPKAVGEIRSLVAEINDVADKILWLEIIGDPRALFEAWLLEWKLELLRDELDELIDEELNLIFGGSTQGAPDVGALDLAATGSAAKSLGGVKAKSGPKLQSANAGGFDGLVARLIPPNHQGLWWNAPGGSESGWGINFTHQGDIIFATWFTYDLDGKPWWLAFTAPLAVPGIYLGHVFTTAGPPFNAVPFDPAKVVETTIGTATLTFIDGNTATFAYTVNGISQTKTITRQQFSAANTACR